MILDKETFLSKYQLKKEEIIKDGIVWDTLEEIYMDFNMYKETYETQAEFIANTLRAHKKIHTVKSRVKDSERLIEKIIRKTEDRKSKYGEAFQFSVSNYKEEIITANVREGDDTKIFEELNIQINSRKSGYRSVHYLIEFFPTNQKVIAEIQVRTIFEEGYGEIDHQLRYSHKEIPEVLKLNLLLFNRIAGSSDEMASFINMLSKNLMEMEQKYEKIIDLKDKEIEDLKRRVTINK